jgi:hypothetical protein
MTTTIQARPIQAEPAGSAPARPARVRLGWQEHLRDAADLALLGFVLVIAALPVVTAGAALATGSYAVRHRCDRGRFPPLTDLLRTFARAILPGLAAALVAAGAGALLALDISAARSGAMPGGAATVPLIVLAGVVGAGYAGLTIIHIGIQGGAGWRRAARAAIKITSTSTSTAAGWRRGLALVLSCAGVLAIAAFLAMSVPATIPLVVSFSLFALHVIHRKAAA